MKSFTSLAEGGTTPVVITEGGGEGKDFSGGGVLIILLFLIVIAVVLIPFITGRNREPVVTSNSTLSEILPAMMVMQSTAQRQTVDVNSHNTGTNGGPSNFDIYRQNVATNDNVFVQSCQTRELVREDGQKTRDDISNNRMHDLELALAERNATIISLNNQLTSERQFSALTAQNTANYNSLQQQLNNLSNQVPKSPVPAVSVSPYGPYRPGAVYAINE